MKFRPGVLPNDASKPRLKLKHFLTGAAFTPPPVLDWDKAVSSWPVDANDRYGDCVWAMIGHAIQTWSANVGYEIVVPVQALLKGYSDVTGFNPADSSTDNGTVMQDAFNYWRRIGVGGHKILAFAEVDHTNEAELQAASALFGVVLLAIGCPRRALDQFEAGVPWDAVVPDGGNEGGHAIMGARYDAARGTWYWITWGKEQPVTFAFVAKYLREAWVAIAPEWIAKNGKTPSGLDLRGLGAAFAELTGEPNPFPGPPSPPAPKTLAQIVSAMATDHSVAVWVHNHHFGHAAVLQDYLKQLLAAPR